MPGDLITGDKIPVGFRSLLMNGLSKLYLAVNSLESALTNLLRRQFFGVIIGHFSF